MDRRKLSPQAGFRHVGRCYYLLDKVDPDMAVNLKL